MYSVHIDINKLHDYRMCWGSMYTSYIRMYAVTRSYMRYIYSRQEMIKNTFSLLKQFYLNRYFNNAL